MKAKVPKCLERKTKKTESAAYKNRQKQGTILNLKSMRLTSRNIKLKIYDKSVVF